jgi:TRAP-type uncharacterized transport system fused permease subunit
MKGKYVFILWAEAVLIPVLLAILLSSFGLPMAITWSVIIIVLFVTLSITILQIVKEERANESVTYFETEEIKALKQKEKIIVIIIACFFVIGIILMVVSSYYSIASTTGGNVGTEGLSFLSIVGRAGSFLCGLSFFLIILWAYIRDKQKKLRTP